MKLQSRRFSKRASAGFTLIELLVVVLIIGILAAIAVPQYFKVVEKARAAEGLAYIDSFKSAQERRLLRQGSYCTSGAVSACGFDTVMTTPRYFTVNNPAGGTGTGSWSVTLVRTAPSGGSLPQGYEDYHLNYDSGATTPLTCTGTYGAACTTDLLP